MACEDRAVSVTSAECHGDRRWNSSKDGRKAAGGVALERCR